MLGQSAAASTVPPGPLLSTFIPDFIPQDGLQWYFDAGVEQSYNGTGNLWTDLVSGNKTATLNNITYSPASGGYFELNGTNSFIEFGSGSPYNLGTNDYTIYVMTQTTGEGRYLFQKSGGGQILASVSDSFGTDKAAYFQTGTIRSTTLESEFELPDNTWSLTLFGHVDGTSTFRVYSHYTSNSGIAVNPGNLDSTGSLLIGKTPPTDFTQIYYSGKVIAFFGYYKGHSTTGITPDTVRDLFLAR